MATEKAKGKGAPQGASVDPEYQVVLDTIDVPELPEFDADEALEISTAGIRRLGRGAIRLARWIEAVGVEQASVKLLYELRERRALAKFWEEAWAEYCETLAAERATKKLQTIRAGRGKTYRGWPAIHAEWQRWYSSPQRSSSKSFVAAIVRKYPVSEGRLRNKMTEWKRAADSQNGAA